jgi:SAM-dependent methyltransferase
VLVELLDVPAQDGVLWRSEAEALAAPTGDIRLAECPVCSYVWNVAHDPARVRFEDYDVSLEHSPAFHGFVTEVAARLVERYGLRGKVVLDIGCGQGHFLETICELGGNTGVGFDPSHRTPAGGAHPPARVRYVRAAYDESRLGPAADLVACRHVLDIVADPLGLLRLVADTLALRPGAVAYVEVPDATATFARDVVWNVVYEHRSWFTTRSLARLAARAGLEPMEIEPCWRGEYLGMEARGDAGAAHAGAAAADDEPFRMLAGFAARAEARCDEWRGRLAELARSGRRAVVWGAGARAITFLSVLDVPRGVVPYTIGVNPRRQGLYLPRSGHEVRPPRALAESPPDVLVVSNPAFELEIRQQAAELVFTGEVLVL